MRISPFIRWPRLFNRKLLAAAALGLAPVATCSQPMRAALGESTTAPVSTAGPNVTRQPIAAVRPGPLKAAEYRLVYKFHPNEDVYMPLSVDSQIRVQKGPAEQISSNQSKVERHFHVVSVEPGWLGDRRAVHRQCRTELLVQQRHARRVQCQGEGFSAPRISDSAELHRPARSGSL